MLGQRSERTRVLREEHICLRAAAFFEDLRGHLGAAAVADFDVAADGLLELFQNSADEFLVATGIDDQRIAGLTSGVRTRRW